MGGIYQVVSGQRGKREVRLVKEGLTVTGWPRPDRSFNEKLGLSGFGFNGQTLVSKDGCYLATLYGHFKDAKRYSLVLVECATAFSGSTGPPLPETTASSKAAKARANRPSAA